MPPLDAREHCRARGAGCSKVGLGLTPTGPSRQMCNLLHATTTLTLTGGVSWACTSKALMDALGRTDSIEVYFRLFKHAGGFALSYDETNTACEARAESEDLTADLIALLVSICSGLQMDFAVYEEERDDGVMPTAESVRTRIQGLDLAPTPPPLCAWWRTKKPSPMLRQNSSPVRAAAR